MGQPKALLPWGERTFLESVMTAGESISVARRGVVTRPELAEPVGALLAPGWELWINPEPERGMLSSLQTALLQLQDQDWLMVALVDQPGLSAASFARMAAEASAHERVCPSYEGRQGHPVVLGRDCFARLLAGGPEATPRDILRDFPRRWVVLDDPHTVTDFDTPEELASYQSGLA